jgi:hypothetical protein
MKINKWTKTFWLYSKNPGHSSSLQKNVNLKMQTDTHQLEKKFKHIIQKNKYSITSVVIIKLTIQMFNFKY